MTLLHALILGLVEGITEFLPVSSTAHLLVTSRLLGIDSNHSFEIAIQSGAMLAILGVYISQIKRLWKLLPKIVVAMIPTLLAGALLYPVIKGYLFDNWMVIGVALAIGGIIIVILESYVWRKPQESAPAHCDIAAISWRESLLLGLCQVLALVPGVSRSGATIIGGRMAGIDRRQIVQFSFMLGVPTILAATAYDLWRGGVGSEIVSLQFLVAFIVSAIAAYITARWFLRWIEHGTFVWFGWYRIFIGIAILLFFL